MRLIFRNTVMMGLAMGLQAVLHSDSIQFNRDIRPILSNNCFQCHGPDANKRKADLRLDTEAGALADLGGYAAVVPGDPVASEMMKRVTAKDPDDVMPPVKTGKNLTPEQIGKLRRWISEGAAWQGHWAYEPLRKPAPPESSHRDWARNPIDPFIAARLEREGLQPSPQASEETLVRRASLTLTGLPPSLETVGRFLKDDSPESYSNLIDRLLESPHYGEHMARYWLDGARYGDTHGLHLDNERSIWPYRDWVIRAFNENKPFDQFTVEQIAGDLTPNATRDQLTATGFNRCNVTTSEGGAIPEEFAVRYAVDRASTLSTVWMGMTAGCAVCHDHKFDPLTQKEFYSLYAFYNNLDENPMDGNALLHPPTIRLATPEQDARLAEFDERMDTVNKMIRLGLAGIDYEEPEAPAGRTPEYEDFVWVEDALPEGAKPQPSQDAWKFVPSGRHPVYSGEKSHLRTSEGSSQHYFENADPGLRVGKDDVLFAYVYLEPGATPKSIMLQFHSGGKWDHRAYWGEDVIEHGEGDNAGHRRLGGLPEPGAWTRLEIAPDRIGLKPGSVIDGVAYSQFDGIVYWDRTGIRTRTPQGTSGWDSQLAWERFERESEASNAPESIRELVKTEPSKRSEDQRRRLEDYFLEHVYSKTRVVFDPLHEQLKEIREAKNRFDQGIARTMITRELEEPRETHVLIRGEYDKPGEKVQADVPSFLPPMDADQPKNRLGLARWLVRPDHPLTARVVVNRFWQWHFGVGLVKTSEDFGSQGEAPSHPELLDWLAAEFIESGWDVKRLQRLILNSAAFRQSSIASEELRNRDPQNRLLARGPKFRLDAEIIRDNALAIGGMLVKELGGHGVKPYQPPGLWKAVAYPTSTTAEFKQDHGNALYRRSLYTFWKRTSPPPAMVTFDAPSRESCQVRRERTNTPLQALVLMNDPQFMEASRGFAERMLLEGGETAEERLIYGFRLAAAREPDAVEIRVLKDACQAYLKEYEQEPEAALGLIQTGESVPVPSLETAKLAAWTMVANTILNLDETITLH